MQSITELYESIMGNLYWRFLFILGITLIVAYIAKLIVKKILKPLAKKTKTKVDDLIIKSLASVIFYLILAVGFKIGFQHFDFESPVYNSVINSLLILIVCILLVRIINNLADHWKVDWAAKTESTADDRLIPLIEKIMKTVVIILAVIFIFDSWNVDISPLLATAGIAGIAISFAVKDSLANIIGGLQLVLDKTFKVGDKVELDSGELGVILDIGLRSTKLRTYDNEVIYIPNGNLANTKLKNFTVPDVSIRVNVEFGVVYGSNPDQVRQVVLDAVQKIEEVMEEPAPVVHFVKMSDFSLDFIARVWVQEFTQAYNTKLRVTDEIYKALNAAGIGIPFPTHTVYTKAME